MDVGELGNGADLGEFLEFALGFEFKFELEAAVEVILSVISYRLSVSRNKRRWLQGTQNHGVR
jgi:hypothetical protein